MIKEYLRKQPDCVLWTLLADISSVMESRTQGKQADTFWLVAAGEVKEEIDRRLFTDYDKDDLDDLDNEED